MLQFTYQLLHIDFKASCSCNSAITKGFDRDDTFDALSAGNLLDVEVEIVRNDTSNWPLLPANTGCIYPLKLWKLDFMN